MSQLQHVEEDLLAIEDPPANMSQLQHVEDDSLASGDLPTEMSRLHVLEDSLASGMSQLQHAEEDSRARRPPADMSKLKSYSMLRKTNWPVETDPPPPPQKKKLPIHPLPPPCRPSCTAHGRNCRGQLDSPNRPDCPCHQRAKKKKRY